MEIGNTSEVAVNINETTFESVEETEHVEYAENIDKLGIQSWFLKFLFSLWL